jgi:hypothetical protein
MGIRLLPKKLGGRVLPSSQPVVVATVNVFAPGVRSEPEIIGQQTGKVSRSLS